MTKTGKLLTIEEAEAMGLLDDLDLPWDKIKSGFCSVELRREEADEAVDESEEASEGRLVHTCNLQYGFHVFHFRIDVHSDDV